MQVVVETKGPGSRRGKLASFHSFIVSIPSINASAFILVSCGFPSIIAGTENAQQHGVRFLIRPHREVSVAEC